MMANTSIIRKRSRENEGDTGEEFFPLSKRINSLQISGEFTFLPNNTANPVNHLPVQSQSQDSSITQQSPTYSPELNLDQNPHYYNQNKDLYELYLLRQFRYKQPYV